MTKQITIASETLSLELKNEIENFKKRNTLVSGKQVCCEACLNAHLIKKARALKIALEDAGIRGEIGHEGYYIDSGKLIKL